MDEILQFLGSMTGILLIAALLVIILATIYFRHDSFPLTDLSYRLPWIGKLNRYSRDYSETQRGHWLNAEASLCHDYARHVTALSKKEFRKNSEYLRKAYDHGRKPIPTWIWVLFAVLVLLEGLGFSYLLSSWMTLEGSANDRRLLTAAIVVVLAAILVWVTHSAGHQIYRTRLLRSCFKQFQAHHHHVHHHSEDDPGPICSGHYTTQIISLRQDQSVDDHEPAHVQCANRVATTPDDLGSYTWVLIAAFLVVFIAVLSTVLRIETLHASDLGAAGASGDLFGGLAPADGEDTAAAREYAALSSFWILATIFVVTQLIGMGVGYKYGFASKQGEQAFKAIKGCADYEAYFAPIRRRMSIADLRLTDLHRLMERRLPMAIHWDRDFLTFIRQERERGATDLQDPTNLDNLPPDPPPPSPGLPEEEAGGEKAGKRKGRWWKFW